MANSERIDFKDTVIRELFAWSNGYCMICKKAIAGKKQGIAAHIIPASKDGPRSEYRQNYSKKFIESSLNGLWLCPNCHTEIDSDDPKYSCKELLDLSKRYKDIYEMQGEFSRDLHIKEGYFRKLADKLKETENLDTKDLLLGQDLEKINIDEKNRINNLTNKQIRDISKSYSSEFLYIYNAIKTEELEAEAAYLSTALIVLYNKLSKKYKSQKEIFDEMLYIMKKTISDYRLHEIDILSYYYVMCEIFKKR